jgi:putative thioredoxin
MFGLRKQNAGTATTNDRDIFDVSDSEFMERVVEASMNRPIIVDFWAPWCGPCKQLGPTIERAVSQKKGKVALAKVNIDENPMVAQQLRVQSIPAVFAFIQGRAVPGFMGAVAPSEIKTFVDEVIKTAGGDDIAERIAAADKALAENAVADALQMYGAILQAEPEHVHAIAGLARCYIASGDLDIAKQTLSMVPADKGDDAAIVAARSAIELAEQSVGAAQDLARHRAALETDPNNHQARFDLALSLVAVNDRQAAVDALLELFKRDRDWNDGAAKTQLMTLFEALGPNDPTALAGRRKLSSMIFA